MEFCGEILYETENGQVHSDICFHASGKEMTDDYRKYLHDSLDEWLNKANGTGAFWVGDTDYFNSWEKPW